MGRYDLIVLPWSAGWPIFSVICKFTVHDNIILIRFTVRPPWIFIYIYIYSHLYINAPLEKYDTSTTSVFHRRRDKEKKTVDDELQEQ